MISTTCSLCGRGPVRANSVSHSKRRIPRRQRINIQMRTLNGVRVAACTRCVRTLAKV
ncbi:MAG: bL28 family ribosomal protein [Patescibacteria group bacterium]